MYIEVDHMPEVERDVNRVSYRTSLLSRFYGLKM